MNNPAPVALQLLILDQLFKGWTNHVTDNAIHRALLLAETSNSVTQLANWYVWHLLFSHSFLNLKSMTKTFKWPCLDAKLGLWFSVEIQSLHGEGRRISHAQNHSKHVLKKTKKTSTLSTATNIYSQRDLKLNNCKWFVSIQIWGVSAEWDRDNVPRSKPFQVKPKLQKCQ